ncbi:phosphohydrolase [Pedobacter yulinensis]|uniref:Phosphohydrolase n=1 Tax=Pedobacter yulinensis TaxID=2126353 RepID=A0A2T3HJ96_9SPHI|nr:HD domain-containing protein [Pedobacter yulinensis]PST82499.1 phosphohydrolase [Pedobacter yulinensis]
MIKVNDMLYGSVMLPAVFKKLLETPAMKRLAGIHQSGAIFLVNPDIQHTRLEHSIGVCLLVRMLGGTEEEQIAGLLHDVSHTAFSHVADYVFANEAEDYHEQIFKEVVQRSEIPAILDKYGYCVDRLFQAEFSILEQPLPYLCADRLDYTLRDALHTGMIGRGEAGAFLKSCTTHEGCIVVTNEEKAGWIDSVFARLNAEFFMNPLYLYANKRMAVLIGQLLERGQLSESDLLKDDTALLNKIRSTAEGREAIQAIRRQEGYQAFLKKEQPLQIKKRFLRALFI